MIYYDSHKWRTLLKVRGSVLPKAIMWALPSCILAITLKFLEHAEYFDLTDLEVLTQGDIYSGFTYVLGFSLVFRTSQAYARYWTAATSVHEMASEWSDSCASLIAFAGISRSSKHEVNRFRHTVVRLFSLLHAMALSEVAHVENALPLLDVGGLSKGQMSALVTDHAQGKKVHIVLCWIKAYIIKEADRGLLNVPTPILTRVFQELGAGLVKFHAAQQIVIWPFPFPYTQLNVLLITVYTVLTPLVISTWRASAWVCCCFTFISVTCMVGLDLIASDLENPFGEDPNDLPVVELQQDMNKFLTMQLNPLVHSPPELLSCANIDYQRLCIHNSYRKGRLSLKKQLSRMDGIGGAVIGNVGDAVTSTFTAASRGDRLRAQMRWRGEAVSDTEIARLHEWLNLFPGDSLSDTGTEVFMSQEVEDELGPTPPDQKACKEPGKDEKAQSKMMGEQASSKSKARQTFSQPSFSQTSSCEVPPPPTTERGGELTYFLTELRQDLKDHLSCQLEVQKRELQSIEHMLSRGLGSSEAIPPPPDMDYPDSWSETVVRARNNLHASEDDSWLESVKARRHHRPSLDSGSVEEEWGEDIPTLLARHGHSCAVEAPGVSACV